MTQNFIARMPSRIPADIKVLDPRLITEFGGLPKAATPGSAAADVVACGIYPVLPNGKPDMKGRRVLTESLRILPGERVYIGCGFAMHIQDENYACLYLARSGTGAAMGLIPAQCAGLIDSDYTGELLAAMFNRNPLVESQLFRSCPSSNQEISEYLAGEGGIVTIHPGERIGQIMFVPKVQVEWNVVDDLEETARGAGGFGSTGHKA
jgi:dUTP pyrophosphatase